MSKSSSIQAFVYSFCKEINGQGVFGVHFEGSKLEDKVELIGDINKEKYTRNSSLYCGILYALKTYQANKDSKSMTILIRNRFVYKTLTKWIYRWDNSSDWKTVKGNTIKNFDIIKEIYTLSKSLKVSISLPLYDKELSKMRYTRLMINPIKKSFGR